jgi:6-phosphogluconolactonase
VSPDRRFLYATNEVSDLGGKRGAGGGVLAFAINQQNGTITHLNTQPSLGTDPCNMTIDATGSRVLVANHGSFMPVIRIVKNNGVPEVQNVYDHGSVVMFAVKPDGSLEPACDAASFGEELSPVSLVPGQAHSVYVDPGNRFVVACDVGADHLYVYRFDAASRTLGEPKVFPTPPGRATRHGAFHPRLPYFFVINERESSLSSFHFDSGTGDLAMIQTVPTVVDGYSGPRNAPADIRVHPNGKFVYGGNRGDESIAIFKLDEKTGQLTPVDIVKTQGAAREFNFDPSGRYLFAANPQANAVVTFAVDPDTGRMTPTGAKAEVPKPVCIHFAML